MKLTVLLENTAACPAVEAEHGLSLFIETDTHRILFDMGQSDLFARNAEVLGVDLTTADLAVLSHGHYDHGGRLARFLEINRHAPVYVNPHVFEPHYNGTEKYIGLDTALAGETRLIPTCDGQKIGEGLTLYTADGRKKQHDLGAFGLMMEKDGVLVPEDFRHEQYLLIEEAGRRILVSGCSHNGIMDIMEWFRPDVLIGGFHFTKLSPGKELEDAAGFLNGFPTVYYTCHCTGTEQYAFLQERMENLHYIACGETILL
ncbi:MAG: MBL fold metallo-hydrolase [Clostridia bacterium]|nr:MBL fold metallo-hydrolase [Clostridia bacterium]